MNKKVKKPCYRKEYDCIEGDAIRIECRKPRKWKKFNMSGTHKGSACTAYKNAKATILKSYTNVK